MNIVNAICLDNADNNVTLAANAKAGDTVVFLEDGNEKSVEALEDVPAWHKMAVKPVEAGGNVLKYGAIIGKATKDISPGKHVHVHNMRSPVSG